MPLAKLHADFLANAMDVVPSQSRCVTTPVSLLLFADSLPDHVTQSKNVTQLFCLSVCVSRHGSSTEILLKSENERASGDNDPRPNRLMYAACSDRLHCCSKETYMGVRQT